MSFCAGDFLLYRLLDEVIDLLETYREMTSGMLDIYLSSVSVRMNDIMRVLTMIATILNTAGPGQAE
ncbi:Mg2+ and Co2+ transporter CorA [Marinobacter sp. MBR-99]|uniref:CorA family divalent cation transporter n=1 Tax=Marinobacter sp. MBR-99 TaxID=3156461 RepID=UPI00339AF267